MSGLALITTNALPSDKYTFDPFPLAALSAGIAPTLIMVRAKLGQNVESLQEAVSDIRFTSQPARQGFGGISTTRSQVQVVSVVKNAVGDEQAGNAKEASVIV
ncbi:hypothetical protein VNI00_018358 [Paramarasmius palmivorus]|uniref:Uncharacterized protein n=2 Tax=Paramarasmius palmivorus TaxID=297713 RepID=A0AAW0AYZ5_9AGAR